jgi:protein TonB
MEAEWIKKSISNPLPTGPIALALTYKQPEKTPPLPKKSPEIVRKVEVPKPKKEKKEPPKPELRKKVRKPQPSQKPKPRKKSTPVAIAKKPPPEMAPEQVSQPLNEPLTDYEASPPEPAEAPIQVAALPFEANTTPEPPPSGIREAVPLYRENPPPTYPRIARRKGYEGTVVLEVLVNAEGKVADCRIRRSCGHFVLDNAAMKSIRNWVFEPGMRGEKRVEMWVKVPIRFELK